MRPGERHVYLSIIGILVAGFAFFGWQFLDIRISAGRLAAIFPAATATSTPVPDTASPTATATSSPTSTPTQTSSPTVTLTPTSTPLPTETATLTPIPSTPTPAPPTATPVPKVVKEYPEQRSDNCTYMVKQWSNGEFTATKQDCSPSVPAGARVETYRDTLALAASTRRWFDVYLLAGDTVQGRFVVSAGGALDFHVTDPNGNSILATGRTSSRDFTFVASQSGWYRMVFSVPGIFTNKLVDFSYTYPVRR